MAIVVFVILALIVLRAKLLFIGSAAILKWAFDAGPSDLFGSSDFRAASKLWLVDQTGGMAKYQG